MNTTSLRGGEQPNLDHRKFHGSIHRWHVPVNHQGSVSLCTLATVLWTAWWRLEGPRIWDTLGWCGNVWIRTKFVGLNMTLRESMPSFLRQLLEVAAWMLSACQSWTLQMISEINDAFRTVSHIYFKCRKSLLTTVKKPVYNDIRLCTDLLFVHEWNIYTLWQSNMAARSHRWVWWFSYDFPMQYIIPIGSVCKPYMVCHLPSIYPSHVSINLPYDWIRHGINIYIYRCPAWGDLPAVFLAPCRPRRLRSPTGSLEEVGPLSQPPAAVTMHPECLGAQWKTHRNVLRRIFSLSARRSFPTWTILDANRFGTRSSTALLTSGRPMFVSGQGQRHLQDSMGGT